MRNPNALAALLACAAAGHAAAQDGRQRELLNQQHFNQPSMRTQDEMLRRSFEAPARAETGSRHGGGRDRGERHGRDAGGAGRGGGRGGPWSDAPWSGGIPRGR